MNKFTSLFSVLFLTGAVAGAQSNGTINPLKGQKYLVENKINTTSSSEMMGQTMESKADISSTYNIEVKEVKDNNINLLNTITSLKMSLNAMGQDMNFDSDKKEDMDGEIGKNIKDNINNPKAVVLDKTGKVILDKKPADTSHESNSVSPSAMAIRQMAGDPEEQGYGAKMAFEAVPKNLKVGSTWADSSSTKGITKSTTYTVKEINGNDAKISLMGTMVTDMKTEMQGMEIQTKTTGKFSGEEVVDVKSGVVRQNTSTTDASGTISVMGQDIPTTTKVTSVTTVKSL